MINAQKQEQLDYYKDMLKEDLSAIIKERAILKEREAKVLHLYFGAKLDGQNTMTLKQIGSVLGVSSVRARQIKEKALRKLRRFYWQKGGDMKI